MSNRRLSSISKVLVIIMIISIIPFQQSSVVFGENNGIFFEDDTSNLASAGWILNSPPQTGLYITDNGNSKGNPNGVEMKSVDAGEYLLYGDGKSAGYITMAKSFSIGPGAWKLQFDARFADLITPSKNNISRGVMFNIYANNMRYAVTFNDKNKALFMGTSITYKDELNMPEDDRLHTWQIEFDGQQTVSLWLDGVKVAEHSGMGRSVQNTVDQIVIYNIPLDWQAGTNEVYLHNIKMFRPVKGIVLNQTSITLPLGASEVLSAIITPLDAGYKNIIWISSDPSVATVDSNGVITAVSEGSSTITAETEDGGFTAQGNVTVVPPVSIDGVSLNKTNVNLPVGESETLIAIVTPSTAENKNVSWISSDPSVATVDLNGVIIAVSEGSATITVETEDGRFTAQSTITVVPQYKVDGILLNKVSMTLYVNESETLNAVVTPSTAENKNVIWSSSNPAIASVDSNGTVTAILPGVTTVTAKTEDGGFTASCYVTVQTIIGTLFEDDCSNLQNMCWELGPVSVPVPNAYIIDSNNSFGNPNQVLLKSVESGQYLFYGDEIANDNRTYSTLSKNFPIGPGAWTLDFDARFADLMTPQESIITVGISFNIVADKKLYKITFNDKNKVLFQKDLSGTYYKKELVMPTDNTFHNWKIAFDGFGTVSLFLDQEKVCEYEGIGQKSALPDGLKITNYPLDRKSGITEFYLDNIKMVKTANNVIINDDTFSLLAANWIADVPQIGSYITDNIKSNGTIEGIKPVDAGRYMIYGNNQATTASIVYKPVVIEDGIWTLTFDARIPSLVTPNTDDPTKGLSFEIVANGMKYQFTFNDKHKLYALKNIPDSYEQCQINIPTDTYFHNWKIANDENNRTFILLDGVKVAVLSGLGVPVNEPERISIINNPVGDTTGTTEVYLDNISLGKGFHSMLYKPVINGVTVLPLSDSMLIGMIVSTSDIDPLLIMNQSLTIQASIYKDNQFIAESSQTVTGATVTMNMFPQSQAGRMRLVIKLMQGDYLLYELTQDIEVRPSVEYIDMNQSISATDGKTYLFNRIDLMTDSAGRLPMSSGWKQSHYQYDGSSEGGIFLENESMAEALDVPVSLNGWFGVYVGYVSGTQDFSISDDNSSYNISIDGSAYNPDTAYGSKVISEVFVMANDFNGNKVKIATVTEKMARIAYIKFKSLTANEISVASKTDEGVNGKRVIYNNDGNTQFANGQVTDEATLRSNSVGIYANQDVGALYYATGTTFWNLYNSQYTGIPYANMTPDQEKLMRSVDKKIRDVVLQFVNTGKVPLEIVAQESQRLGIKTFASLRMNAFYGAQYPWLNGNIYPNYETFKYKTYYDSILGGLSYGYSQFRDIIKNILQEAASFQGVQGVELDFNRTQYVLGWESPISDGYQTLYGINPKLENTPEGLKRWEQYRANILTEFMRELRQQLPDKQISVRIPSYDYFKNGFDIQTWVDEGLIDIIVPSSVNHEMFWDNLNEFADMVQGTNVKLYGGINYTLSGGDLTKQEEDLLKRGIKNNISRTSVSMEQYLHRAYQFYQAGYDGIYLFNNIIGTNSLGLLGDKVKVEKWYNLSYPAMWVQNLVTATRIPSTVPTTGIELNRSSSILKPGENQTLTAIVTPENATNKNVLWSTNDQNIATVDANGVVRAVSEGEAIISATTVDKGITSECMVIVDKTVPAFSLELDGATLKEGDSFEDYKSLTFKVWDELSGISSARISIDSADYNIDPGLQLSIDIDFAGNVGEHTAIIVLVDCAGNRLEKTYSFTVIASLDSIKFLIERYISAGELYGPMAEQLKNTYGQAKHQIEQGRPVQAIKHMSDFIKHLDNKMLNVYISDNERSVLKADAEAIINVWMQKNP